MESPLIESEKSLVLKCAKVMEINGEENLSELVDFILTERGNNPVLVMKVTLMHLWLLNEEMDLYHRAKAIGPVAGDFRTTVCRQAALTPRCRGQGRSCWLRVFTGRNGVRKI